MWVLCAGILVGSGCGHEGAPGTNAVVGPGEVAAEDEAGSGAAAGEVTALALHLTPAELMERGWSCQLTPVGSTACTPPGQGLPVLGAPEDRPPTHKVWVFDTATGEYLGFTLMIRTDLYAGQHCATTGAAYNYLPHIGYYECFNPVG